MCDDILAGLDTNEQTCRLETFDFRAQEQLLNQQLPQHRVTLPWSQRDEHDENIRIHFVHRRATVADAVPLLFCHDWGSSFIEVTHILDALCDPVTTPTPLRSNPVAFHVVCPSIPGFGYGDAMPHPRAGLTETADLFKRLMHVLGYKRFMLVGNGWYVTVFLLDYCKDANSWLGALKLHKVSHDFTPILAWRFSHPILLCLHLLYGTRQARG